MSHIYRRIIILPEDPRFFIKDPYRVRRAE